MTTIVISPHLDDAVLSCGQFLAGNPGATVVTVFTHAPEEPMSTEYDRNSGFGTAREACYRRRQEDHRALNVLGALPLHMGERDGQYGLQATAGELCNRLAVLDEPERIVVPLGLKHPDHDVVAEACRILAAQGQWPNAEWWVYEDLPSRVLYPETVGPAFDWWRDVGTVALQNPENGPLETKYAAVCCYESQLWALDLHAVLCPERLWRLWR